MVTDSENKTHIATQPRKGLEPKPSDMSQVRNRKEKHHTIKSRSRTLEVSHTQFTEP